VRGISESIQLKPLRWKKLTPFYKRFFWGSACKHLVLRQGTKNPFFLQLTVVAPTANGLAFVATIKMEGRCFGNIRCSIAEPITWVADALPHTFALTSSKKLLKTSFSDFAEKCTT
jgi:hypothetical protein